MERTLKIIAVICISSMILVGCGNKMFDKAIEQGKLAVASKEYDKAKASFQLALEEKEDEDVKDMLVQVEEMLAGLKEKADGNIEDAIEHFKKVADGAGVLPSLEEVATEMELELELELQEIQDKISEYDASISEAETMIESKKYGESKDILNKVIEETNEHREFELQNEEAQVVLGKIHLAVTEEEDLRKQEAEKEAKALEKKKNEGISISQAHDILVKKFNTDEIGPPTEYEHLSDGGYAHNDKKVLDNYYVFMVNSPYEYEDEYGNVYLEYSTTDANLCVHKKTGGVEWYSPGEGIVQ